MQGGMQISWAHSASGCGEGARLSALQNPSQDTPMGHSHLPPLKSTEASSTKATHLRGETAWQQPGSKPAQRGHLDPRKDLPSCHGWGKEEELLGRAARAGGRWGCAASGREEGRWLPHPALLLLTSSTGGRKGCLGLHALKKGKGKQQGVEAEGGSTNTFLRGLWGPEAATRAPQGVFLHVCLPPWHYKHSPCHSSPSKRRISLK